MYYKRHFPPGTEKSTLISQKVATIKGGGRWDERTPSSIVSALLLGPAPTKCANPSGIIRASLVNAVCSLLCQKTQLISRKHRTEGCPGFQLLIHTVHTPCVKSSFALPTTQRVWETGNGFPTEWSLTPPYPVKPQGVCRIFISGKCKTTIRRKDKRLNSQIRHKSEVISRQKKVS